MTAVKSDNYNIFCILKFTPTMQPALIILSHPLPPFPIPNTFTPVSSHVKVTCEITHHKTLRHPPPPPFIVYRNPLPKLDVSTLYIII